MSDNSRIEWTDATWNPVRGCTKISPGCKFCYAETFAERFRGVAGHPFEQGFDLRLVPEKLTQPLSWRRSRRIFVNSMSDLFHERIPTEYIAQVGEVARQADWHTFQILTKRHDRMRQLLRGELRWFAGLSHVWFGVSIEDRRHGLPRLAALRDTPTAIRFLSIEPLLEDLGELDLSGISWVIVGGESGPHARPMRKEWVVKIQRQCRMCHVPFFFKQWGGVRKRLAGRLLNGRSYDEFPVFPASVASRGKCAPWQALQIPIQRYWQDYGPFQQVKHDLIRRYLGGWFAKLGGWAGRVLYVDTHAGRGRHVSGEPGSPLVALQTLLRHSHRDRLLEKSCFRFLFIERDPENLAALRRELAALGQMPEGIHVDTAVEDAFALLSEGINRLTRERKKLAPAFVFVDPYGFKVPAGLLAQLMVAGRVELFVNVIWRELDMAVQQRPEPGSTLANTLDSVFGGNEWRVVIDGRSQDERLDQAARLLAAKVGAGWWTYIRMVSGGNATRYMLLHLTNHDAGRDLIKDCLWRVCPDGGFHVLQSDQPGQPTLFEREPNLGPLKDWIVRKLAQRPHRWRELETAIRPEMWTAGHLNKMVLEMRRAKVIVGEDYAGRFSASANPVLRLRIPNEPARATPTPGS